MNKDKLNEACDTAFLENYFPSATESPDPRWEMFADGFKQGAQWVMQQPLSDRLTDEEKEKIRERYNYYMSEEPNCYFGCRMRNEFELIFGKELFNKK